MFTEGAKKTFREISPRTAKQCTRESEVQHFTAGSLTADALAYYAIGLI